MFRRFLSATGALLVAACALAVWSAAPASADAGTWWNNSYSHRQALEVKTTDAIASGYSVSAIFDHASLVSAGRSLGSGNDVRIVRWDGASWTELDRVLAVGSLWNNAKTKILFKTQAAIGASGTDASYYLYYGNAAPTAPMANANAVYQLFDDFSSGTIDASKWNVASTAGVVPVASGGELVISGSNSGGATNTKSGITSVASMPPGFIVESSFRMPSASNPADSYWLATFGAQYQGVAYYDFNDNRRSYGYYDNAFYPVAVTTLGVAPVAQQRIGEAVLADGSIHHYENNVLIAAHSHFTPATNPVSLKVTGASTGAFDARYDDVVVRLYVANEPMVKFVNDSASVPMTRNIAPYLTFSINGRGTTCNGQSATNFQTGTTSSSMSFGQLSGDTAAGAAQDLSVTTNAQSGFTVFVSTTGTTPNPFRDSSGRSIADVTGTKASPGSAPVAGTPGFGYTAGDALALFGSNTWVKLTNTKDSILIGVATGTKGSCVGHALATATSTPASSYSTTVLYSVVPQF